MQNKLTKDDPRFDVVLDASDPDFAKKLREAIGLKPGEKVEITTPQFERTDGRVVTYFPKTKEEYELLPQLSDKNLKKLGLGKWGDEKGFMIWLYPKEWYSHIPEGLTVVGLFGEEYTFERATADDDIRYGCLAYGLKKPLSDSE